MEEDDTIFVGFVISLPGAAENAWGEPVLPKRSISPCLGTLLPSMWCLDWPSWPAAKRTVEERAAEVGIRDYATLVAVTNAAMRNDALIAESFCRSVETIRRLAALMPDACDSVRGVGIHADDLRALMTVYRHAGPGPSIGVLLDSPRKAPPNCEWLGYELLAADEHSTGHHSWLCNGIEEVARSRGYSLARDELFSSYADAKVLAHDLTTGTVNAEPGLWLPWRVADCADLFNA